MPNRGRSDRARETEFLIADYLKAYYPEAEATQKSAPGVDVKNIGQLALEVKATSQLPLLAALRQAHARASNDDIPIVVWRPNGYGKEKIGDWVVATRVTTFFNPIAFRAGYFL